MFGIGKFEGKLIIWGVGVFCGVGGCNGVGGGGVFLVFDIVLFYLCVWWWKLLYV